MPPLLLAIDQTESDTGNGACMPDSSLCHLLRTLELEGFMFVFAMLQTEMEFININIKLNAFTQRETTQHGALVPAFSKVSYRIDPLVSTDNRHQLTERLLI